MNSSIFRNCFGYIEGYYGNLLDWEKRKRIIDKLSDNKMKFYFYAPKEDILHRLNWRKEYEAQWLSKFNEFCKYAHSKKVKVIFGLSPGLDFDFQSLFYQNKSINRDFLDFKILLKKFSDALNCSADYIALLLDDIDPKKFLLKSYIVSEGKSHASLANAVSESIGNLLVVPRVYADELKNTNKSYLNNFFKTLNSSIPVYYCGQNIVAKSISKNYTFKLKKKYKNQIIFWDNYYANDYCPRKIFLGPWVGRLNTTNIMFNLTGMIETDLLLLDLINITQKTKKINLAWSKLMLDYKIPKEFNLIQHYFFPLHYKKVRSFNYKKEIEALDFLLWKWKSDLSREWYQYVLILKQDLQFLNGEFRTEPDRIEKIFSIPFNNSFNGAKGRLK